MESGEASFATQACDLDATAKADDRVVWRRLTLRNLSKRGMMRALLVLVCISIAANTDMFLSVCHPDEWQRSGASQSSARSSNSPLPARLQAEQHLYMSSPQPRKRMSRHTLGEHIATPPARLHSQQHDYMSPLNSADSHPPTSKSKETVGERTATLTLALISNNRQGSLRRLCDSLLAADYSSLGRFFARVDVVFNLEASSDDSIIAYALGFEWRHGSKQVRKRARQGGLILAVSESWYPSSKNDYGCLLEDDIEVSAHYFQFVTEMMMALQREPDPRVVGISLYSPRRTETTNPPEPFNSTALVSELLGPAHHESPYMMQTPCSWGAVYFPEHWQQFVRYLQLRFDLTGPVVTSFHDVEIPHSRTNGWKGSWKKFHFELLYINGQYLMYPNFEGQHSLSTNHMEKGEHITNQDTDHKRQDFVVPLLVDGTRLGQLRSLRVSHLPVLNLFGVPWLRTRHLKLALEKIANGIDVYGASAPKRDPSMLAPGETISSTSGEIMVSGSQNRRNKGSSRTEVYYGVVQKDGQFVVYQDDKVSSGSKAVWSTNSFQGEADGIGYNMSLTSSGSLRLKQFRELDGKTLGIVWSSPPDPTRRDSNSGMYAAVLESDGNFAVYWKARCRSLVWESGTTRSRRRKDSSFFGLMSDADTAPRKDCDREEVADHPSCSNFPAAVPLLLEDASTFTLLISTHSRFQLLSEQLLYYSASPVISTIVVTWHNMNVSPPPEAVMHGTHIRFHSPSTDSLNNRFQPLVYITTEAVLILDDDIKLHLQDMHNMFVSWQANKRNLIGVSPRWVSTNHASEVTKLWELEYKYQSEDPLKPHGGYSLMLTRALMMHRDYLQLYSCGGKAEGLGLSVSEEFGQLRSIVRSIVAAEFNCEDIGLNFIANAALSNVQLVNGSDQSGDGDTAPLFVQPMHRIGDFGKMGGNGLHQKTSHLMTRTECLNQMNRAFWKVTGRNLAPQMKLVAAGSHVHNSSSVDLSLRQYSPLLVRLHDDCLAITPRIANGTAGEEACSWELPRHLNFQARFHAST